MNKRKALSLLKREIRLELKKGFQNSIYKTLPEYLKKDKDILRLALQNGGNVEFVPLEIREDKKLLNSILRYFNHNYLDINYCQIIKEKETHEYFIKNNNFLLDIFEEEDLIWKDENLKQKSINLIGKRVIRLSYIWNNDESFMRSAIQKNGYAYINASDAIKDNIEIAKIAIENNREVAYQISDIVLDDKEFVLNNIKYITKINDVFLDDEDVLLAYIKGRHIINFSISERLKNSYKFALQVLKVNPKLLSFFGSSIKNDKEMVLLYLQKSLYNYKDIPNHLKSDLDIFQLIESKRNKKSSCGTKRKKQTRAVKWIEFKDNQMGFYDVWGLIEGQYGFDNKELNAIFQKRSKNYSIINSIVKHPSFIPTPHNLIQCTKYCNLPNTPIRKNVNARLEYWIAALENEKLEKMMKKY